MIACTGRGEDEQLSNGLMFCASEERKGVMNAGSWEREVLWRRGGWKLFVFEEEQWGRVFSIVTYKPFLTFSGGLAVWALTEKNHMSTIISGWLEALNNSHQQAWHTHTQTQAAQTWTKYNKCLIWEDLYPWLEAKHLAWQADCGQ